MKKAQLVERLIAQKKFPEISKGWLSQLELGMLEEISASCGCTAAAGGDGGGPPNDPPPADPPPAGDPPPEKLAVAAAKPKTVDEWLALAPTQEVREEFVAAQANREMYAEMRSDWDAQGGQMRTEILANEKAKGLFAEAELKVMSRTELKRIHALTAAKPAADYSSQGIVRDVTATKGDKVTPMPGIKIGTAA